jgi:hypothetical protein
MRQVFALYCCALAAPLLAQEAATDSAAPAATAAVAGTPAKPGAVWRTITTKDGYQPLTRSQRWELYWRGTYWTPAPYFAALSVAAQDQYLNQPREWGQGFDGYLKRAGDQFARLTMQSSIEAAAAAVLKQEVRYVKCGCTGTLKRAAYSVGMIFATLNDAGEYRPAYARFAGAVGAQFIGNTWTPRGYRNWDTTLRDGGLQLGFAAGFNLVREFLPKKKP